MSVERITVETNDETGNNPIEYDWEFDPDGVFHMTGDGDLPANSEDSTAIVDGERIAAGDGSGWLKPFVALLAARLPFVAGSVGDDLRVSVSSPAFLGCCRSLWIGADVHRGFGRYLNLRWNRDYGEWVEAGMGLGLLGGSTAVAEDIAYAVRQGDGLRFDPVEGSEDIIRWFRLLMAAAPLAGVRLRWEA